MSKIRSPRRAAACIVAAGLIALTGACSSSSTGSGSGSGVRVTDAWARSTASLAKEGAVYFPLRSASADTLTGVAVDAAVAKQATMHESMMDGSMMNLEPLDSMPLSAGESVVFEPGKKHVMLDELATPLVAGATFTLHLTFAKSAAIDTTVTVRD